MTHLLNNHNTRFALSESKMNNWKERERLNRLPVDHKSEDIRTN
jgi:hypothetical protein